MAYSKDGGRNAKCYLPDHHHANRYCPDARAKEAADAEKRKAAAIEMMARLANRDAVARARVETTHPGDGGHP